MHQKIKQFPIKKEKKPKINEQRTINTQKKKIKNVIKKIITITRKKATIKFIEVHQKEPKN